MSSINWIIRFRLALLTVAKEPNTTEHWSKCHYALHYATFRRFSAFHMMHIEFLVLKRNSTVARVKSFYVACSKKDFSHRFWFVKAAASSVSQLSDAATSRCLSMPTLDGDGRVWGFQTKLSTTQYSCAFLLFTWRILSFWCSKGILRWPE